MLPIVALLLAADVPALTGNVEVSPAVMALGKKYGERLSREFETDLEKLEKLGDRSAAVMLGELMVRADRQGGPNYVSACNHAEAGGTHPEGLHNLATCYFNGTGRSRNLVKARELYRQAAVQGYAKSACAYGNMMIGGEGGPVDQEPGLDLCRRAADAGIPDAQTDYGGYLLTGEHMRKDPKAAWRYLSLAAAEGQPNAQYLLGQMYMKGDGVEKSEPDAGVWLIKAYDGGRRDAAFLIGLAAMRIVVDGAQSKHEAPAIAIEQAKKWLGIAVDQDPDQATRAKARELLGFLGQLLHSHPTKGG